MWQLTCRWYGACPYRVPEIFPFMVLGFSYSAEEILTQLLSALQAPSQYSGGVELSVGYHSQHLV